MATSSPQTSLEDMVTCSICMERMKNPKHLQCQHTFCEDCLKHWITQPGNSKGSISCPVCRHVTAVRKGIHMLPADIGVTRLLDMLNQQKQSRFSGLVCGKDGAAAAAFCESCGYHLCKDCFDDHVQNQTLWPHLLYLDDVCCSPHAGAVQDLYCQQCDRLGCRQCMKEQHKNHPIIQLAEVAETNRDSMRYLLDSLKDIINSEEKTDIMKVVKLESRVEELKQRIEAHANKNHTAVDVWQKTILATLRRRSDNLVKEVSDAECQMEDCSSLVTFLSRFLEEGSDYQLVAAFSATSERLHQATDSLDNVATSRKIGLNFVENPVPRNCGMLITPNTPNQQADALPRGNQQGTNSKKPSSGRTSGRSFCSSSTQTTNLVDSRHAAGRSFCSSSSQTTDLVYSVPSTSGDRTAISEETVTITVPLTIDFDATSWQIKGIVQEKALHDGPDQQRSHRVKGLTQWLLGVKDEDLEAPVTVAASYLSGLLYYGTAGWWTPGQVFRGSGPLHEKWYETKVVVIGIHPKCIAISPVDGKVAISVGNHNNTIIELEDCTAAGSKNSRILELVLVERWHCLACIKDPYGVAITHDDHWIVVDHTGCCICIYYKYQKKAPRHLLSHGRKGDGPGEFNAPTYVCHDPMRNRYYVSDTGNNRIQAFNMSGGYLWQADGSDSGRVMRRPRGLCLDGVGNILVADTGNRRIAMLGWEKGDWLREFDLDFMPHSVALNGCPSSSCRVHLIVAGLKGKMPFMKILGFQPFIFPGCHLYRP